MKYLIAIKLINKKIEIFEFKTKEDRLAFLEDIQEKFGDEIDSWAFSETK